MCCLSWALWQLGAYYITPFMGSEKGQCCQVYHVLENERFDKLFKQVREKQGSICIPMAETLRRIIDFRQKKQPIVIGYISDQAPFWNNIPPLVTFPEP